MGSFPVALIPAFLIGEDGLKGMLASFGLQGLNLATESSLAGSRRCFQELLIRNLWPFAQVRILLGGDLTNHTQDWNYDIPIWQQLGFFSSSFQFPRTDRPASDRFRCSE